MVHLLYEGEVDKAVEIVLETSTQLQGIMARCLAENAFGTKAAKAYTELRRSRTMDDPVLATVFKIFSTGSQKPALEGDKVHIGLSADSPPQRRRSPERSRRSPPAPYRRGYRYEAPQGPRQSYGPGTRFCYYCKEEGHMIGFCPKKRRDDKGAGGAGRPRGTARVT